MTIPAPSDALSDKPANRNQDPTLLGGILIALICASFGANAVAIKIALTGLGVFTSAAIRFTLATLSIILWARITGRSLVLKKGQLGPVIVITVIFILQISLYNFGLKLTLASRGVLMSNLQPFFVLILAHFFIPGDRITLKKTIGIAFGFAGVTVLLLQKEGITADLRTGDLMALASVILWATNAVYTKNIITEFQPFHLVLYPGVLSIPVFILEALLWDSPMIGHPGRAVIYAMLYQGIITAFMGFVLWMELMNRYGAVAMHAYVFILPIAGVLCGALILNEPVVTPHMLTALSLVVAGIIVVNVNGFARKRTD
jgi:drug/metabolite transporter (DMT)-like permease